MDLLISTLAENIEAKSIPRSEDIDEFVAGLKEVRGEKKRMPKSLKQLSVKCILGNKRRFLTSKLTLFNSNSSGPFANLPNLIAQDVVAALSKETSVGYNTNYTNEKFCFLLQLLNPHILEFEFGKFYSMGSEQEKHVFVFRHMLQNCPKIRSIVVSSQVWKDMALLPRLCELDLLHVMAHNWPNLTYLKLDNLRFTKKEECDSLMAEICDRFPKLCELVVSLADFSKKGSRGFSKLEHLKFLSLELSIYQINNELIPAVVEAAGQPPNLEKLALTFSSELVTSKYHLQFLELYGKLFSNKKLTVDTIRLSSDLTRRWPSRLLVDKLHLEDGTFPKLLQADFSVQALSLKEVPPFGIYPLVDKFSSKLIHLTIKGSNKSFDKYQPMDPFRVIAACPKLQTLRMLISGQYAISSNFKITPDQFRTYKYFKLRRYDDDSPRMVPEVSNLFKMYLLGSRKYLKKLKVESLEEVEAVLWALDQEKHTCLDQVEEIVIKAIMTSQKMLSTVLQMVMVLAERSRFLKKVSLNDRIEDFFPPKWFKKLLSDKLGISFKYHHAKFNSSDSEGPGYEEESEMSSADSPVGFWVPNYYDSYVHDDYMDYF